MNPRQPRSRREGHLRMGLAGVRRLTGEREVANLLVRALKEADAL